MQILALASILGISFGYNDITAAPVDGNDVLNIKGQHYKNNGLAGFGYLPSDAVDNYGDSISLGSGVDVESCTHDNDKVTCTVWGLPDRGWNTKGTVNFTSRIYKLKLIFEPKKVDGDLNINLDIVDTILLKGPDGRNTTGYESSGIIPASGGYPELPGADIGLKDLAVCIDAESIRQLSNGHFLISDEYGPYVYEFDQSGQMLAAIKPVDALVPREKDGEVSFNSGNPPIDDEDINEPKIKTGRSQNKGFEGLTVSPDGNTLFVMLQSATIQDGGDHATRRQASRIFRYDISGGSIANAKITGEWVVKLPHYNDPSEKPSKRLRVAAMSEILYISPTQLLILNRDNHHGNGQDDSTSIYRHIDVIDISDATNILGSSSDKPGGTVADGSKSAKGKIQNGTIATEHYSFINYNDNSQLSKFGAHNGGDFDRGLLNEKWESLSFLPLKTDNGSVYLLSASDNDFVTQNGHMDFNTIQYKDQTGFNLDSQVLIWSLDINPFAGWIPHQDSSSTTTTKSALSSQGYSTQGVTSSNKKTSSATSTAHVSTKNNATSSVAVSTKSPSPSSFVVSQNPTTQLTTQASQSVSPRNGTEGTVTSQLYSGQGINANATATAKVSVYTTYCPSPTTFTAGSQTYVVTKPTTLTISDCSCTEGQSAVHTTAAESEIAATSSLAPKLATSAAASNSQPAVANSGNVMKFSAALLLIPLVLLL